MVRARAAVLALLLTASCGPRDGAKPPNHRAPLLPTPLPSGPVFAGRLPVRLVLASKPLGVSPDGALRFLVRARFVDRAGAPTALLGGGDVSFSAPGPSVQWQTRLRFGGPAAIVAFDRAAPVTLEAGAAVGPPLARVRLRLDPRAWRGASIAAAPVGPHLVQIGWFPATAAGTVVIGRAELDGAKRPIFRPLGLAAAPARTFRDSTVRPGRRYAYAVAAPGHARVRLTVAVPAEARAATPAAAGGKAVWLSFSPSLLDVDAYARFDPRALAERARRTGLRAIYLRVAYGAFDETAGPAGRFVDALLDAAAERGVAVVAWTVPRSTDFEDLAAEAALAERRTARGTRFAGLAVDLERGPEFLGSGPDGYAALTDYLRYLRLALGPRYPLVATVEDPYLEHLDGRSFPYAAIAASADVLQPMTYWRMLSRTIENPEAVRRALRESFAAARHEAGRPIPIDLGAQTAALGVRGAPPAAEISAAVAEAKRLGAVGITFFDWGGTNEFAWRALGAARW